MVGLGMVQDAAAYEEYLERKDYLEAVEGIRKGLESMRRGEGRDAEEVFAEIEAEFGLPAE
jgi:hypothetical protein